MGLFGSVGSTAMTLLTTGTVGLIAGVIAYDKYQTEARKKRMEESRETIKTLENEIASEKQRVNSIRDVAKEYDSLRSKSKLTAEEQQKYLELTRQIAEVFPELVSGYDKNGDPILKLNGSLETYIGNLDKAIAKQEKLLNSEENKLADDWEAREKELQANKWNQNQGNLKPTGIPNTSLAMNGTNDYNNFDAQKYLNLLKDYEKNEEEIYKERLKNYEEYETAIKEVREKYRNQLQNDAYYKNATDQDKAEIDAMMDNLDLYSNVSPDEAKTFTAELAKQKDTIVATTSEMGKCADAINKLEEQYSNGKITLDQYSDGLNKIYEETGKIDNESFTNWLSKIEEYANTTGSLAGVNKELQEMGSTLEKITGIDADLWTKTITPNLEPIEMAKERLQNFLQVYKTGSEHLGAGGLADKLEKEFQVLSGLPEKLAKEFSENGTISTRFILDATVDSPTPIKNLVSEFVKDGEVDTQELNILLEVIADIQNGGEITPETEALLREYLPDDIEEEVIAKIKVSTDAYIEGKIDDFLKTRDELNKDIESEIRVHVDGTEEVEAVYNAVEKLPEDKRLTAVSNYGQIKDECYMLGISIDQIPTDTLINISANLDDKGIDMFIQTLEQVDQRQVKTFLKTEGAVEALQKCESVQQMLDLINGKKTITEIEAENSDAKEKIESTKTSLESVEGEYQVDLMVQTDKGDLDYIEGQIYEIDGKTYICTFNVDTNKKELVEFNGEIKNIPEKKTSTVTFEGDTTGVTNAKQEVEKINDMKVEPEVTPVIKEESGGFLNKIKNFFGIGNNSVEVTAKVTKVDTSALSSLKIDPIKITADSSGATTQINTVKTSLAQIQDKTVKILADGSNATLKITNIITGLAGIQDKTVKILADSSNATLKITNVTTGLTSIQDKTVKILADSSNAMLKITRVTDGLAAIPDRTVTIKVNASQAMSAISSVKSGMASIKSKAVSLNVTKTVTERTVTQSSVAKSTSMLSNSSLASVPVSASASSDMVTASDTPSLANTSVSASANNSFGGTLDANKILSSLDFDVSHIKNLEEALERLGNQLDLIDEKSEAVFGQEKVDLLQQQIPLLKEQQRIQEQIAKNERAQNNELIYWLSNQGFTFDNLGNITNYNNKLLQMEQNVESLKKKYDDLNSASGDNKNETAIKNANKAYESANETLSKTKKYLEEYFTTNNQELIEASKKWWEYENTIRDVEESIRDVSNASLENKIDAIADDIDFLDAKMENLNSEDKIKYLEQQNDLYREQQKLLHQLAEQMRAQLTTLNPLSEEYAELASTIKGLSTKWWDLENSITDNQMSVFEEQARGARNEVDRLGDQIDFLDAKMGAYSGVEKVEIIRQQNALYRQQQNALHVLAEQLRAQLSLMDVASQEYANLQSEIKGLSTEWWDLESSIKNNENDIVQIYEDAAEEAKRAAEEARKLELEKKLNPLRDSLADIKYELEGINDQISLLEKMGERAQGAVKIDNLQQQISVLNQKLTTTQDEFDKINKLRQGLMSELAGMGFSFDTDGSILNYGKGLGVLAGTEEYEEAKQLAEEYMNLLTDDYNENKENIIDIQNTIKELQDEIVKAERELALFSSKNRLVELNEEFDELSNKLDIIDSKMEYAFGTDKITLMRKNIDLLNDQLGLQTDRIETMTEQMQIYTDSLSKYGFVFDNDGDISNYAEIMEKFRDDEQVENIKELCEEYMDLCKEVENLTSEYADLENAVKNAYNEMLDTTKEIEDKITDVIKKEYEERKKEIEDYTDERIKLLEKEKRAMQDLWDNKDYEESVEEQSKKIMDLQKRINVLMGDTSIVGQQKLKELTEELTEAQKELEELTEDKIRNDYENNIDKEIEKLEEEEQSVLEALDEKFSDIKIAEMVQQALTSGFLELNGEIQSVQDVLINSINESAEGYSVMAEVIKNQLVANLNVALSTTKELSDIYKNLDLNEYGKISALQNISTATPNMSSGTSNVTFGDTIFNVSGSADSTTLEQVEEMIKQSQEEMLDKITKDV